MPTIGEYTLFVSRYPRTLAAPDATGEEVETWAAADPVEQHWARLESSAGSETTAAPRVSYQNKGLRFRHEIDLEAVDHVYIEDFAEEYAVAGVWRERSECGGWQTVCSLAGPL